MKRARAWAINLALVLVSFGAVFLLARGVDFAAGRIYPPPPPSETEGIIYTPNTSAELDMYDYTTVERINSMGFRDEEVPRESEHAYRIVAVGDSFTYGWGVNLEDTWCKVLERNLRARGIDAEVLNLGRPAAGPAEYPDITRRAVYRLKPDLVIIGLLTADDLQQTWQPVSSNRFFPNLARIWQGEKPREPDMNAYIPERTKEIAREEYKRHGENILGQMTPQQRARFDALPPEVRQEFHAGRLNPWLLMHSSGSPDYFLYALDEDEVATRVKRLSHFLREVKAQAEWGGAEVIMLGIPEGFLVNDEAYRNVQRIGFEMKPEILTVNLLDEQVSRAAQRLGIPFFSATEDMRKQRDATGLYLEMDRHMAPAGNVLFADIVTPFVADFITKDMS